jgi:hypothetical protein
MAFSRDAVRKSIKKNRIRRMQSQPNEIVEDFVLGSGQFVPVAAIPPRGIANWRRKARLYIK